jgi:limonene-1,2-epoxide hydrolase
VAHRARIQRARACSFERQFWRSRSVPPLVRMSALVSDSDARERSCSRRVAMTPEEVVRAQMAALASLDVDQIMAYFADDATFLPGFSFPTYSGLEDIRRVFEGFLKVMTKCDVEIVNLAVAGNVVLTERVDRLIHKGKPVDAPGMGTFEVSGDKITAWRDYFYLADT